MTKQELPIEDYSYNHWMSVQDQVKVLQGAHRGCGQCFEGSKPSKFRENTLESFEAALKPMDVEMNPIADFVHANLIVCGDKRVFCYSDIAMAMNGKATTAHGQNFKQMQECAADGKIKTIPQLNGDVSRSSLP